MCVFLGPLGFLVALGIGAAIIVLDLIGGVFGIIGSVGKGMSQKLCPYCRQQIPQEATVCKYCGRDTRDELNQPKKDSELDQAWVEEFIYKFNKAVTNISSNPGNPVDDSKVLSSFFDTIKEKSFDTPRIKGLENKNVFEQTLLKAEQLVDELKKNPEVQDYIQQQIRVRNEKARLELEAREKSEKMNSSHNKLIEKWGTITLLAVFSLLILLWLFSK